MMITKPTRPFRPALLLLSAALVFSCASSPAGESPYSGLSRRAQALVQEAVFEVVVLKPVEARGQGNTYQGITYDKELDFSPIPFAVRSDEYYSIGTAFAVSPTELVTAYHVMDLNQEGSLYSEYFIRDNQGLVYEVDQICRGSSERDFLVFTVLQRTFEQYFEWQTAFAPGDKVYSIGNALGEGIVVRNGLVLGTVPEDEGGRWDLLKSSADGNPGNSGGPLITAEGRVAGVVIALRDNILYSLPARALLETPPGLLTIRQDAVYSHLILSNQLRGIFEYETELPLPYRRLRSRITEQFHLHYVKTMEELFQTAPAYLTGPGNLYFLGSLVNTGFPELAFVDRNDLQWKLSGLRTQSYPLPGDGAVIQAALAGGVNLIKIDKPDDASLGELNGNPRILMELILKAVSMERSIGSIQYRILSYGEPESLKIHRDSLGRTWSAAYWPVPYENAGIFLYVLPLPGGPAAVLARFPAAEKPVYEWDLEKIIDHLQAAYGAPFSDWIEFFNSGAAAPEFFGDLKIAYDQEKNEISLNVEDLSLLSTAAVFEWTKDSSLFLAPGYYLQDGEVRYGLRKILIQRDVRGRDYGVIQKNIRPDPRLGARSAEGWQDLVLARYPFDGVPRIDAANNTGTVGRILFPENSPEDLRYFAYLTMENPVSGEDLLNRLDALLSGLFIPGTGPALETPPAPLF
jgi:hypothetical protein